MLVAIVIDVVVNDRWTIEGNVRFCKLVRKIAGIQFMRDFWNDGRFDPFVFESFPSETRRGIEEGMLLEILGVAWSATQSPSWIFNE